MRYVTLRRHIANHEAHITIARVYGDAASLSSIVLPWVSRKRATIVNTSTISGLPSGVTLDKGRRKGGFEFWRSSRFDPIAYAWGMCNPGAPFPAVLWRGLTAVYYSHTQKGA